MKNVTLFIGILLLAAVGNALTTPYLIVGQVFESDGATPAIGASVTATNIRTGETITDSINTYGWYANVDAGNFPSGYVNGDTIQIAASKGGNTGSTLVQIDTTYGGLTAPPITLSSGGTTTTVTTTTSPTTSTTSPTTTISSGLTALPSSLSVTQTAGTKSSYYLTLHNSGVGSAINIFVGGIPSDWLTIEPANPYIAQGQSIVVQIKVDIPDDEEEVKHGIIYCNAVNVPLTLTIEKKFYEVIEEEWLSEDELLSFNGFEFTIVSVGSDYIRVDLYEDGDEIEDNQKCYEDGETELGSHFKVFVHNTHTGDEKAEITLYADEEFDNEIGSSTYKYTLFENVQLTTGTWLSFDQHYLYISTVAATGVRVDYYASMNYPESHSCFINSDCKVGDLLLNVESIMQGGSFGTGTVVLTLKSNKQQMVYQGTSPFQQQQQTGFPQSGLNQGFPQSGLTQGFTQSGLTQTTPYSSQGNVYISIAGGKIAPNHKVIFFVKDYNNMPVRTGTLTVDLIEPLTTDISEGLATIRFPPAIECPILLTAAAAGYQTTPQVFTSCSEEGGDEGVWWSTSYASQNANCSDGKKNCHDGGCEEDVDCGGPCSACKLSISLSTDTPSLDKTVEVIATSGGKGMVDVEVTVTSPDDSTEEYTTDSDGKIDFVVEEYGTYTITAELEGYATATKTLSTKAKTMTISLSPSHPEMGDTVYLMMSGTSGSISPTKVTVNGLPIQNNVFTVTAEGEYIVEAELAGYDVGEHTFKVYGVPILISRPDTLLLNEVNTFTLNRPAEWLIMKDGLVVDSGTQYIISFTPTEPGTYSIMSQGNELARDDVGGGIDLVFITVTLFIICALFAVLVIARRKSAIPQSGGLRDKKQFDEVDEIVKKIQQGKEISVDSM